MSDVAQKTNSKKVLSDSKKAWLCQIVGGQILFTSDCGFVARDDDGNPIDLDALQKEVADAPDSDDGFGIDFEITEKKAILARYGIPSISDAATEFREGAEKKDKRLQEVRNLIELQKEEIRSSMDYDMQVKHGLRWEERRSSSVQRPFRRKRKRARNHSIPNTIRIELLKVLLHNRPRPFRR